VSDDEDSKDAAKTEISAQIQITLKNQTGDEMSFKIKKTTKLSKVFDAYCTVSRRC